MSTTKDAAWLSTPRLGVAHLFVGDRDLSVCGLAQRSGGRFGPEPRKDRCAVCASDSRAGVAEREG